VVEIEKTVLDVTGETGFNEREPVVDTRDERVCAEEVPILERFTPELLQNLRDCVLRTARKIRDRWSSQIKPPADLTSGGRHVSGGERRAVRGSGIPGEYPPPHAPRYQA
jgi:hypothetical protein